jgi:ubiquinone/menaquinone biosynthesis C-methylase UbiE
MSAEPDRLEVLASQIRYYRARASEYDDVYERRGVYDRGADKNAVWQAELAQLTARFDAFPVGPTVVELAAGTGFWTRRLTRRAGHVTAIDAAPEALVLNRARLGDHASQVNYVAQDLFAWQPNRTWDTAVACFWLCHIPDTRLARFLNAMTSALTPDGILFVADKQPAPDLPLKEVQTRRLGQQTFSLVDHPRPVSDLVTAFQTAGLSVTADRVGERFVVLEGHRTRTNGNPTPSTT